MAEPSMGSRGGRGSGALPEGSAKEPCVQASVWQESKQRGIIPLFADIVRTPTMCQALSWGETCISGLCTGSGLAAGVFPPASNPQL